MDNKKLLLAIPMATGLALAGCSSEEPQEDGDVEQQEADPQEPDLDEEPAEEEGNPGPDAEEPDLDSEPAEDAPDEEGNAGPDADEPDLDEEPAEGEELNGDSSNMEDEKNNS